MDLSGCDEVSQNCQLDTSCSFGSLTLIVPKKFRVETDSSTSFASLTVSGQPDPSPAGVILLGADVSFGEILVKYV